MTVRQYIRITGGSAFIAFVIYLYFEIAKEAEGYIKNLFLVLFLVFSILAIIDALRGGLRDKRIIGKVTVGKKVIRK